MQVCFVNKYVYLRDNFGSSLGMSGFITGKLVDQT